MTNLLTDSSFALDPQAYLFATVAQLPAPGAYRMLFVDDTETTVVAPVANEPQLRIVERNPKDYRLIRTRPSAPFYATGFTGAITTALGQASVNVVVLGTYSFDYLAIRAEQLDQALAVLRQLGLREEEFK